MPAHYELSQRQEEAVMRLRIEPGSTIAPERPESAQFRRSHGAAA
jgi:hypothetical protein